MELEVSTIVLNGKRVVICIRRVKDKYINKYQEQTTNTFENEWILWRHSVYPRLPV